MITFTITKEHLSETNEYIGKEDLSDFNGHIESDENIGTVRFKYSIHASGRIYFEAGSGIEAGWCWHPLIRIQIEMFLEVKKEHIF